MILMIDNYDSFTFNLVDYLATLGEEVIVRRNDAITLEEIENLAPEAIVISPGPCSPKEAGISVEVVRHFHQKVPILGVCLGMQCIGVAFGGKVIRAPKVMHGKTSLIRHDGGRLFAGLPPVMSVTRYHSLIVERETLPDCLRATAFVDDADELLMAFEHQAFPVFGVQFHPEAILSEYGHQILQNFLEQKVLSVH